MVRFNRLMDGLIEELIRKIPEFATLKKEHIRVSAAYSRKRRSSGLLAYVVPMKYKNGSPIQVRVHGKTAYHYAMLPVYHEGVEVLYYVYFLLPRFLNLSFRDKLETVVHELYHIHPDCNGDFRRLKGRSYLHGNSLRQYDEHIRAITDKFLRSPHEEKAYEFLRLKHWQLRQRFGEVVADRLSEPRPKLIKKVRLKPSNAVPI